MSVARAAARRGNAGQPLPTVYQSLAEREAYIARGQLCLIAGPPESGKSLIAMNLLLAMGVPSLALLLDQDQMTATARFGAAITGDKFSVVRGDLDEYQDSLEIGANHVKLAFNAEDISDIYLQLDAYEQRYGEYPVALLVDNLGNLTSGFDNEGPVLKALCLDLDALARREQIAVIACHHMTDLISCEPAQRDKLLFKVSQYPRLILSVGFNKDTGEYKVAIVKNSNGPSDRAATNPITMYADPSRMQLADKLRKEASVDVEYPWAN